MKISKSILSLPPYISTSWKNVSSLRVEPRPGMVRPVLIVQLTDNSCVEVPDLEQDLVERIFEAHAAYIENGEEIVEHSSPQMGGPAQSFGMPFRFGLDGMDSLGGMLQHDRAQADSPDLPQEILSKIACVAQVLGAEQAQQLPKAEPGCNCFHCQVARAIQDGVGHVQQTGEEIEEEVSDEDLTFRIWDIVQDDDNSPFYKVTNPADTAEQYTVHLGTPVGCTCGHQDCEHIKAVLNS